MSELAAEPLDRAIQASNPSPIAETGPAPGMRDLDDGVVELNDAHRALYDTLAGEYEDRADRLLEVTENALTDLTPRLQRGARILDVGSGAGNVARVLADAGFETLAIDLSEEMARVTRNRSPRTEVVSGDYLEASYAGLDAIVAFAFIHLFPTSVAQELLRKCFSELAPGGYIYVGTTRETESSERFEVKADFPGGLKRFRRRWTRNEFYRALRGAGFEIVQETLHKDPFGKTWMDFTARRPRTTREQALTMDVSA